MQATIRQVDASTEGLAVTWPEGGVDVYPWFWLRDHGEDRNSQNEQTLQRRIDTFSIDRNVQARSARLSADGTTVFLEWFPEETTHVSADRLAESVGRGRSSTDRCLWKHGVLPDPVPTVDFEQLQSSENAVLEWLKLIQRWGFAVVHNTPPTEEATVRLAERIGPAQETIFGDYWRLSSEVTEHDDTAYTSQYLSPHTDASYSHDAPGLQMFNCLEFEGSGGESVLVDGFAMALEMAEGNPQWYKTLATVLVPGRYIEPGVNLLAERPAFRIDRFGELVQITFNNYDRAPFIIPPEELHSFYDAYRELNRLVSDDANWVKIPLRPGMALIFDNWRCLHGRMAYIGRRTFYGCYLNRGIYESRLRSLWNSAVATAA